MGAAIDHRHGRLAQHGFCDARVPCWVTEHSRRLLRGRPARWREPLASLSPHYPAIDQPNPLFQFDYLHDWCAAGVRLGHCFNKRRPWRRQPQPGHVYLRECLPVLRDGLRFGDRHYAVHHHRDYDPDPVSSRSDVGALWLIANQRVARSPMATTTNIRTTTARGVWANRYEITGDRLLGIAAMVVLGVG